MARPVRAVVDLAALRHNLRLVRELAPAARVAAIVKADAYGHGVVPVARAVAGEVDAFGVAGLEEAVVLREAGIEEPILLLAGVFAPEELVEASRRRLALVVHDEGQLRWLLERELEEPLDLWLKLDTGMHRLGLPPEVFRDTCERLRDAPQVGEVILMSHLARADEPNSRATARQLERFREVVRGLDAPTSLANSAAILAWPPTHGDWVRPGLMLYGLSPFTEEVPAAQRLRPVMRFESEVIAVRALTAGEAVGYGGRFVARRTTRIAAVACGYGDGYPLAAPDGAPVAVKGRRAPIAGRVSMDLLTVDVGELDDVEVGDPVELWGPTVPAEELARLCGTISYELVTGVTARVPRVYVGGTRADDGEE